MRERHVPSSLVGAARSLPLSLRDARRSMLLFKDGGLLGGDAPGAAAEADLERLASLSCVLSIILRAIDCDEETVGVVSSAGGGGG